MRQRRPLYRRGMHLHAASRCAVRLRDHERDVVPAADDSFERGHGELRRSAEDQLQAGSARLRLAFSDHVAGRRSPLAVLLHLADLAQTSSRFRRLMRSMNSTPFKVVDLVQQRARQQLLAFDLEPLAMLVLRLHLHPCRAVHLLANIRQAEAAFFLDLLALASR